MGDSLPKPPESLEAKRRRRFGWTATVLWAPFCLMIAWAFWDTSIKFHDLMEAIAAAFGPLALLWLILGYQQQGEELGLQRQQLELQRQETAKLAIEATKQAESLRLSELNARRDTYLRVYELTLPNQISCAFRICGDLESSAIHSTLDRHDRGDREAVFSLGVSLLRSSPGHFSPGQRATADTHFNALRFLEVFDDLAKQSTEADPSGALRKNLEKSGMGSFYAALCFVCHRSPDFVFRDRPAGLDQLRY